MFCKRIPKSPAMNKRQQIQQLTQLGTTANGHSWEIKSQHPTNLTATCTKCGLWIQQVDPVTLFQQVLAQPCMGFEGTPPQHLVTHPSHQLVSIGKEGRGGGQGRRAGKEGGRGGQGKGVAV